MNRLAMGLVGFIVCWTHSLLRAEDAEFQPPAITVPDGFSVELAAAPPLVKHPMLAGFDDRGRLFIAESAGVNLKREELERQLPNFVRMLEDTDGDGRFDKSTIFADKMTFPMGALWHRGALYVASSGGIWRLEDTDDDGVADRREQIVTKFGYTGNAADVHGCFLGPAGRIYWCDGRHGHEVETADGQVASKGKAARIFSCRSDGSDLQVHCGGGMDNPVEIDFTDEGEMLGTVNLLYRQRGDCLVHWMHGGVYPRYDQEAVVAEFRRTGDLLPEVFDLGHVAVSGTTRYRATQFGLDYRDSFFVTEFNTHKVVRLALARDGSTFRAERHEFLSCESADFHPTDVLEDADGSLLVIDTGGWFRIGCPTSQIAKPNILGAIYRIRRDDAHRPTDPRGLKIDWRDAPHQTLVDLLSDTRPAVREKAVDVLAQRGDAALDALEKALLDRRTEARRNAVWVLARNGSDEARSLLRVMLTDRDPSVRQAAVYSVAATRDADAESIRRLSQFVVDDTQAEIRREAATALGKLKAGGAVDSLLTGLRGETDRFLEHALVYALIEIGDREATIKGLADSSPRARRGALIALDQMEGGDLAKELVAPLLDTDDVALQSRSHSKPRGRRQGAAHRLDAQYSAKTPPDHPAADARLHVR